MRLGPIFALSVEPRPPGVGDVKALKGNHIGKLRLRLGD
jgi:hypothetical protein